VAFNHYAKIKRILDSEPRGWYIVRINQPTSAKNFKGELIHYNHYYRIYGSDNQPIKFCKFQKLDKLASILSLSIDQLPILEDSDL
jgi:hypothetical protein